MKKRNLLLITLLIIVSCVKDSDFETPKIECDEPLFTVTNSISQIKEMYNFGGTKFEDEIVIEGYVVSSDKTGNIYKSLSIQDKPENPTAAIKISIDQTNIYTKYEVGRKIFIKLKGLAIDYSYGSLQIGKFSSSELSGISPFEVDNYIFRSCKIAEIIPKKVQISELNESMLEMLIELENVQFSDENIGKSYGNVDDTKTVNRKLQSFNSSCNLLDEVLLRNSGYASFKNELIPEEKGETVKKFFDGFNEVILKMVDLIMLAAPYGVFALLAALVVESPSLDLFKALGWYAITVVGGLMLMIVFYNILVFIFYLLVTSVSMRDTSFTDTLRQGTMLAITMLIPFFVISKSIDGIEDIKTIMFAAIFGIFLQATIGIAETLKSWHLYNGAVLALGIDWGIGGYMSRNNLLRASAALGHPIILGYISAIGLGLFLTFYPKDQKKLRIMYWAGLLIFTGGLVATLSRGPWVGAAAMVLIFTITGRKAFGKITKLSMVGIMILSILSLSPAGQQFINLIPFVKSGEESHAASTISYRQQLLEQSWIIIQRNPLLGSANYLDTPEMEIMRQGEGIIDVVNSYLQIALNSGLIGLGLFLLIFLIPLLRLYKLQSILKKHECFQHLVIQNRALFSTIVGIMVIIFTASGIGVIPIYYWSILGLACAFIKLARIEVLKRIMGMNNQPHKT